MNNHKEKMVEVARFQFPADAYTLMALLESEGIECYLRNEKTASLLSYMDVGGARVEILESNLSKAIEIMKDGGYEVDGDKKTTIKNTSDKGSFLNQIPFIKNLPFPLQIILYIILILILIFAALVI